MAIEGVDYAWQRPSVAGLRAAGKRFACRYGGKGSSGKWIDAAEASALKAAGIAIVANVEGRADGLLGGRPAGRDWAQAGLSHFRPLGMPANRPIYLSVDFNANATHWARLDAAMDGAAEILGRRNVGVYGGYRTIAHFATNGKAPWLWQTYAWSGGNWHPKAHIQQYRNNVVLAGGTVDLDRAMVADYGQWGLREEVDMPLTDADVAKIWNRLDPARDTTMGGAMHAAHARADSAFAMTRLLSAKLDQVLAKLSPVLQNLPARLDAVLAAASADPATSIRMTDDERHALAQRLADAVAEAVVDEDAARLPEAS